MNSDNQKLISPISWIILIGYIFLTILTYIFVNIFDWAQNLFNETELLMKINAILFSFFIAIYGGFALLKNYKRANLSNLKIKLDSQFLLVSAFILFALKEVLVFIHFKFTSISNLHIRSLEIGAIVLNFGGYVAGLASIYYGRKR